MVDAEVLHATPGDRARAAADALGDDVLTQWCADLLAGRAVWGDPDLPDIGWVGGRAVDSWGSPDRLDDDTRYWSRVWAARTLLYVWDDACTSDVVAGLADPAWRVREMCAKVAARWEVGRRRRRVRGARRSRTSCRGFAQPPRASSAPQGRPSTQPPCTSALADPEESVRVAAERALSTSSAASTARSDRERHGRRCPTAGSIRCCDLLGVSGGAGQPGVRPVATGRDGSRIHSLHDPG